eukprot:TRINITY_DN24817_c0_g1_i1.p1 TRINITY_DN24817_c0_g1~~TRINITY_DN24817_c0_g1_i1.p1  ORF type:complete len:135 (+),score=54.26 TRINITY_DN24817_c0_g1_i1:48-407(+)
MDDLLRRAEQGGNYHKKVSKVYNTQHNISETRSTERDENIHRETIYLERDLNGQRVSMTKHRNMLTGEENTLKDLHNIQSDQLADFDHRWMEASRTAMPSYHLALEQQPFPDQPQYLEY